MKMPRIVVHEPTQRLPLVLRESTVKDVEAYLQYYAEVYGEEVTLPILAEHILREFVAGDTKFKKWVKQGGLTRKAPRTEPAPSLPQATDPAVAG